jgi:hypothetical protein
MRSEMRLIVCRATMAACSFQLVETILDPFHGDRLEHISHALQTVDQPGAVRDFRRALPHFPIDIAHFPENAGQAVEVPNPRSRSGPAGGALPFCLRCHPFASVKKAAHLVMFPCVAAYPSVTPVVPTPVPDTQQVSILRSFFCRCASV